MSTIVCGECESTQIFADHQGFHVCGKCGLVLDIPVIQSNLRQLTVNSKGELEHECAVMTDAGTNIGNYRERLGNKHFCHLHKVQHMVVKATNTRAFAIFSQLKAKFDITVSTALFFQSFQKIYPKIKKGSKCRNLSLICTTIFYLIAKKNLIKITMNPILEYFDISKKDYFECIKIIKKIDPTFLQPSMRDLTAQIMGFISRLKAEFALSQPIIGMAKFLIRNYRPRLGEKPEIIAGSAIGIALKYYEQPKKPSNFEISKILQVTASTLYSRVNQFPVSKIRAKICKIQANQQIKQITQMTFTATQHQSLMPEVKFFPDFHQPIN